MGFHRKATMGLRCNRFWFVLVVVVMCLNLLTVDVVNGARVLSEAEDLEIERQLKVLNKPAIKTIHTEWGDILDCVDIHKQPALDHPLLKDHKVQMKPSLTHKSYTDEISSSTKRKRSVFTTPSDECPEGTVPIRRTTKEDLIRIKSLSKSDSTTASSGESKVGSFPGESLIGLTYGIPTETYYAVSANISVYNPTVAEDQFSSSEIAIENGAGNDVNGIRAGITVNPQLYGDHKTRLFARWTVDNYRNTGCYNNICPGFLQVDRGITPDMPLGNTSTFEGVQFLEFVQIYQDETSKHWWLVVYDTIHIGYWPNHIFTSLSAGANRVFWGGHVKAGTNQVSPPLGSGHIPDFDLYDSSVYEQVLVSNATSRVLSPPLKDKVIQTIECGAAGIAYGIHVYGELEDPPFGFTFLFGGPGGKC